MKRSANGNNARHPRIKNTMRKPRDGFPCSKPLAGGLLFCSVIGVGGHGGVEFLPEPFDEFVLPHLNDGAID